MSDLFTQDDELDALLRAVAETDRPSEDLSGQTLAGFVLEERLGEGGMGVVYKARDTTLNRTVALKLLRADKRDDADRRARFLREARAAAALDHPNIARVHAVSVDEHHGAVIALEYIEGQILADALPLAPAEAQRVATEVASALAAAHAAGVVHRDLKPHNVMLDTSGTVKLLDFGLARQLEGGETLTTVEGAIVGTPRYMSPEQARGEKVDARSDVFSFGAMLHELLTGKAAFEGESDLALLDAIRFKAPGKLDKHVPKRLRQVVARCLEKKPEHRFADGAALLYVLEGRGRAKRWLTRTAVASAAVLLLASCAAGVTVYRWTKIGGATPAWHDIEEMTKSYPLPARAAFRRVIQTWYGEDYESSVAAIATVAAFAPDDPFSNFVYALSQGDEDGVKRAIELASDEDRPFYEMASKVSASMRQYPVTYHPSWRSPHDYDDEIEALLENANYHWTLYLARRLNDRGRAIERLKKLVALDPSVVAPHYSLATFLSVERRGDEALKVVAAAREHHPRSTVLDIAEAVANGSLGRWDEMEVIAKRLVASKQKNAQFQGWGMLRESLLRRGDHDAAEQTLDELAKLYPAPASWEPWELHLAAIAQPSHWRPVTEVPPEGADQLLRLLCRRGRLAFLLGDLPRLEQALNDLKAAPDPKWRPQRTRAASVAFLELARATLRGEEAPEVATRVERNRDIEPFARDALLARFHLALGDAPTAEGYINRLSVPQDDRPDTPPRLWLKRLLEIELMQLRGQDDEAREAVGRIVLRDTPCATDYLDDTQPCRAHAAEAYVLQAELEDDPAKVRRALAKLDALWPAPDPELPLVKRTRAARKRSP